MINFNHVNLSKLSRGKGERKGSYIQVIYDDRDFNERNYNEFLRNHLNEESNRINHFEAINENRKLNLPKTFTTRRGPLLLFSEDSRVQSDFLSTRERNTNTDSNELKSFKTIRNLRKSILEFGNPKESQLIYDIQNTQHNESYVMERENTLETFSLFKEIKTNDDPQFEKIRPGFSAKRYLSNLTRHWRPGLFDHFIKEGRIKEETLFEQTDTVPNLKQRIDDDISRVPPAYRINRKWLTMTVAPLKGYRFYRVKTDLMGLYDETTEASVGGPPTHPTENIQVVDKNGNNIDYTSLSKNDKEIVLTELLLQTALQSIAEKRIESIEETFKRNIYPDNSQFESSLISNDTNFGKLSVKDLNPNELILTSNYVNKAILNPNQKSSATSNYLFPRMNGNKLSPIKQVVLTTFSNKQQKDLQTSISNTSVYERKKLRKRSLSQTTPRVQDKHDESEFISNSLQNLQSHVILEEKEDESQNELLIKESNLTNSIVNLTETNSQNQIKLILPEPTTNLTNNEITIEPTFIEIDPKILEEEKFEEELLKKEIEQEQEKLKKKLESGTQTAMEEMLAKKHYQSTVSISNISIGEEYDPNHLKKQLKKRNQRFILNRHNYHHPRKPKNKLLDLYKDAKIPPNIQLRDHANLLNVIPEKRGNFINKSVKNTSPNKVKKLKEGDEVQEGKVKVLGPDGVVTQIGTKLKNEVEKLNQNSKKKKEHEVFYRLFDEIPPYLYYTNKIDTSNTYVKYERENSEKLIAEKNITKKIAEEILETEKKREDEPILNKQILQALTNHAQQMAKIALDSHGSGMDLVKDIKMALNENYKKLKTAYRVGEIDVKEFEEYTHIMKEALKTSLSELFSQSIDFSNVIIDDGLLGSLLEYPTSAFEIVTDHDTKRKIIQIKKTYKPLHTNLANEMNLDFQEIENEVRNKGTQLSFRKAGKDAKLETNVNTSKNADITDAKQIVKSDQTKTLENDDDESKENQSTQPNLSAFTKPITSDNKPDVEETEENKELEGEEKKLKKKKKKTKNEDGDAVGHDNGSEIEKKAKKKGLKNKKDKKGADKMAENKEETNKMKIEENLDPKELKRRQQAEERRLQAERRRLEKEEEKRREEEEQQQRESEARAAEEEVKRQQEELEKKREAEQEKQRRLQAAQEEKERKKREEEEAQRRAEEEKARRMEEMKAAFWEELERKAKQEEEEKLAEERRIAEEQQSQFEEAERERQEILRRQQEYQEAEQRRYEEENRLREEALERAIAEAQRIAIEEAKRQAEYEARLKFINLIRTEASQLENSQLISRAFVFSYYDLLRLIGTEQGKTKNQLLMELKENVPSAPPMNQGSKSKRLV